MKTVLALVVLISYGDLLGIVKKSLSNNLPIFHLFKVIQGRQLKWIHSGHCNIM